MSVAKRYLTATLAAVVLATLIPAGSATAACPRPTRKEKKFARLINDARVTQGDLRLDRQLTKAAKVHTREMIKANTLYHTPSNTLRRRVTNWVTLGENVGVGGGVLSLHQAFMNSPAHRDNILYSSYRYVGVGAIKKDGRLWVTVIFEARSDPGSPLC